MGLIVSPLLNKIKLDLERRVVSKRIHKWNQATLRKSVCLIRDAVTDG